MKAQRWASRFWINYRSNRERLGTFLNGVGSRHAYMIHVGVGWAIARVPWLRRNFDHAVGHLDPLLCWLAADGNGFSDFYFRFPSFLRKPERLNRRFRDTPGMRMRKA